MIVPLWRRGPGFAARVRQPCIYILDSGLGSLFSLNFSEQGDV